MKLLINASNIRKSGALQVTLSFLEEIKAFSQYEYHVVMSNDVSRQIIKEKYTANFTFYNISLAPPISKDFFKGLKTLQKLEQLVLPNCVFSIFGPTYWRPKSPHLVGFAYPWIINPDSLFIQSLPIITRFKNTLQNIFKGYFIKRDADLHVVETEDVKKRMIKYLDIRADKIKVVNNTINHHYNQYRRDNIETSYNEGSFHLITISSNFTHKNLKIINDIDKELKLLGVTNVVFYVTLPPTDFIYLFGNNPNIKNLGVVPASKCPEIYANSHAMLLPTLLECFSATYPEAMIMGVPILTSNLDFAKDICKDAALYFKPDDGKDIAQQILLLRNNKSLRNDLIKKGVKRLKEFPNSYERAKAYIEIAETLANNP